VSKCLVKFGTLLDKCSKGGSIKELSISFLTNYCFDKNVDVISSTCNLIISQLVSQTKTIPKEEMVKEISIYELIFKQYTEFIDDEE